MEKNINTLPALVACPDYTPETARKALAEAIEAVGAVECLPLMQWYAIQFSQNGNGRWIG